MSASNEQFLFTRGATIARQSLVTRDMSAYRETLVDLVTASNAQPQDKRQVTSALAVAIGASSFLATTAMYLGTAGVKVSRVLPTAGEMQADALVNLQRFADKALLLGDVFGALLSKGAMTFRPDGDSGLTMVNNHSVD